ncbi:MAG: sigma 54-interacting transcriptional regulator [Candidatus Marinimicrobia bacterium]|nr:sigma 54-interacting transcriptional regulator [Candidatus Neomarinimicrobiota bacterium]
MDENEFFRQATFRICGNLLIEEALFSTLQFLRNIMPVDRMMIEHYDESMDSMRTIAIATSSEGKAVDLLTPLSAEAKEQAKQKYNLKLQKVYLSDDPQKEKLAQELLNFHGIKATSLLVLVLESGNQRLGTLVLASEGNKQLSQKHADLLTLLSEPFAIALSNTLKHREVLKLKDLLADDNRYLHGELWRLSGDEIIGANFGLKDVMEKVQQVAALDSPVLLLGETGVGKDVIANAIHYSSTRKDGPFVNVNCGAIPDTLIDSELFGHEKGAFTGALSQKRGRFERAHKGTIFLDEIGELPLQAQVRLLKVLQSREIERVGGTKTISLDIRIIAATNRNLQEMVTTKQFREDLWFRLNVFPVLVPPLRDRKSDIPALLQHFINQKAKELKLLAIPMLSPAAIDPLLEYDWPGNVRELENVVERSLILNQPDGGPISFEHLNFVHPQKFSSQASVQNIESDNLDSVITNHIRQVLTKANGKIHGPGGAAELLSINPSTLRNRMNKLGINYKHKTDLV